MRNSWLKLLILTLCVSLASFFIACQSVSGTSSESSSDSTSQESEFTSIPESDVFESISESEFSSNPESDIFESLPESEFSSIPESSPSSSGVTEEGLEWILFGDDVWIVSYVGNASIVEIPSTIEGYPVTAIGDMAFGFASSLTEIIFNENMRAIYHSAFYGCENLMDVTLSNSINHVSLSSFDGCPISNVRIKDISAWCLIDFDSENPFCLENASIWLNGEILTDVEIPNTVTEVKDYAFTGYNALKSVSFPSSITTIGECAFANCQGLTEIELPNSVSYVEQSAFADCSSLTSVSLPDNLTFGEDVFFNCPLSYNVINEINYLGNDERPYLYAVSPVSDEISECVLHEDTVAVLYDAFKNCPDLKVVKVNDNLSRLYRGAFDSPSITSLFVSSFDVWCGVECDYEANPLSYAENLFIDGAIVSDIVIPESITEIKARAFYNFSGITSLTVASQHIGERAFYQCDNLTEVKMANTVLTVGNDAFYNCKNLESVTMSENLTDLGYSAFYCCYNLSNLSGFGKIAEIKVETFFNTNLVNVEIPETVVSIDRQAFYMADLESVTLPNSLEYVGVQSFASNPISNLTWGNGLKIIDDSAFSSTSLPYIDVPDSVTFIGEQAFGHMSHVERITIGKNVETIEQEAFAYNDNVTSVSVTINSTALSSVGINAFPHNAVYNVYGNIEYLGNDENPYLLAVLYVRPDPRKVEIHKDTKFISDGALSDSTIIEIYNESALDLTGLSSAKNIYTPTEGASKISTTEDGFVLYTDGEDVILIDYEGDQTVATTPDGVTEIYNYALCGIPFTHLTISDSVKKIGRDALVSNSLQTVVIGAGCELIENYCFQYSNNLTSVVILSNKITVEPWAFYWCENVNVYYIGTPTEWLENSPECVIPQILHFYLESEPPLNLDQTDYNGNYWHYDENGEIKVWVYGE